MNSIDTDPADIDTAQQIKRLALQLAAVVDALEQRSAAALNAIDDGRAAIARAADDLGACGEQLVATVAREVTSETRSAAEKALGGAVAAMSAQLDAAGAKAQHSADALHRERVALVSAQRRAFWIASVALGLGALAVAGASTWWVAKQRAELREIEFARQIHDATVRGALLPCGDRLCVRVGDSPRRAGTNREFIVVE